MANPGPLSTPRGPETNWLLIMARRKVDWSAERNEWSATIPPDQCRELRDYIAFLERIVSASLAEKIQDDLGVGSDPSSASRGFSALLKAIDERDDEVFGWV